MTDKVILLVLEGLSTAAAAFPWFSELYNQSPYNPVRHRQIVDPEPLIQYGSFCHGG